MSRISGFIGKPRTICYVENCTGRTTLPVVSVFLDSVLYTGLISVAVVEDMPLNGVGCILASGVMQSSTCKSELPCLLADPQHTSKGEGMETLCVSMLRDHQVKSKPECQ